MKIQRISKTIVNLYCNGRMYFFITINVPVFNIGTVCSGFVGGTLIITLSSVAGMVEIGLDCYLSVC